MVDSAPAAVDLQEFQFKLHSKLKIFDFTDDSKSKASTNLIAAASKYGLIFVGSPNSSIEVVQSKTIEATSTGKVETTNYAKRSIPLPSAPSHLALNCDQSLVAVVVAKDGCATAIIYSVPSFLSHNVAVVREIRVSVTSGVPVLETCWNPAMPTVYTACKSDGSLGVYNIQENSVDINEIPAMARATSFCWSPKGKQIVVGSMNGTLTQYKPDLKAVKAIPAPSLQGAGPFSVVNVFWLTNYQFVAVYNDVSNTDARPVILIVNAPKAGAVTYINYEDICYSYGNLRPPQFYIIHQPIWGVLLVASANSMEVGVLGIIQSGEPAMWQQWNQIDAARAELPLSANHQETFPVGFAFDTGIIMQLPWGENQSLPPMPMIHILSHHGVLCSFTVINVRQGVASLCMPPEPVPDQSGLNQFRIQQQAMPPSVPVTSVIATPNTLVTKVETAAHAVSFGLSAGDSPAPTLTSTFAKPTAQPGTLFGGSTAPSLFGTTPNFSAPAVQSPSATASTSTPTMKLPANNVSMFNSLGGAAKPPTPSIGTPTFGAVSASSTGALNFSMTSNASPSSTSSSSTAPAFGGSTLFAGLTSTGTSVADGTSNKTSLTALSGTTAPNFQSMNLSTKPIPQDVATSLNTSTPVALTMAPSATKSQVVGTPAFAGKPMVQPLLATPKDVQPISIVPKQSSKPDILSSTQTSSLNQTPTQTSLPTSDFSSLKKEDTVLNSHAIQCQIRDELKNFHAELQELFYRCRNIDLNVGTEEEKTNIVLTTDSLMEFYKELQETTDSLMTDVHYLKQAVMQSFAWYEDTKSRQKRYTDINYANLLQAQELDPFSEKQLSYIQHLIYDIESQLKQVDSFLDNQWAEFQDLCKKQAKDRMQIPMLEPIYQSLVRQNAILDKQRYFLKDIASRIKTRNRKAASYPSVMNINLGDSKNDIQIDEELSKLKIDNKDIFAYKYEKIVRNERKFTQTKQTKLCEFFTNRKVVHIAPKKPKWLSSPLFRTPSKVVSVPSYITSPNVQRSLNQTFENIAQNKFDLPQVTTVETNISSSNLFSFTLLDSSQTKWQSSEKSSLNQQKTIASSSVLNMPKTSEIQAFKPVVTMTSSVPENISSTYNMKNSASASISVTSAPVFSFTAASSNVTQSKPQYFTSNTNTQSSVPVSFSLGSNITITPVSSQFEKDKTNQVKPNTIFSFSLANSTATAAIPQNKTDSISTKVVETKKESSKPALAPPEVILIKPNVIKTSSATESTFFGGLPTPEVKASQPFTFTVPQPKSTLVPKEPTASTSTVNTFKIASDNIVQGRDSLDTTSAAFSFGKALSLGQQSTPKPKAGSSLMGTVVVPPISAAPLILDAATSSVSNTQKAAPKPAFSITQPTVSVSPKSISSLATTSQTTAPETPTVVSITPVISNVETISTTTSLFANVSMSSPTANTTSLFKQPLSTPSTATANPTAFTTGTPSLFSGVSVSTPAVVSSSIFGQQVASTVSTLVPTPSSTTSIFAQAISTPNTNPVSSNANIFGNAQTSTPGSLFGAKSTTPQTTTSLFEQKTESNSTTSTPSTGFSFVQSAASVSAAELPKQTSIFGGAAQTTSSTGFGSTATTSATGFSFLQPIITTSITTQQTTPKTTIFSSAGETKPTETVSAQPDTGKSSQESTFGFDSLAVSSAENNKFSFGNLTVSALSPNVNTTTTISTAGTSTFSFALPAATNATTTTTTSFGEYGLFCKPATTTTASSFMGQPICSPSTFSQNTAPVFGQSAGNIFTQKPATPSATGGSIFGQNSGGSLFGGTGASTTASTTASIFGQTASTPFGSSAAPATSKTGSIFGQSSDFGSNTAPTTTSASIFGQNTFGTPAATSASSSFSFTQNAGANTSFGASSGSIFGAKPTFGQAPAFGQTASFGSPSAFGSASSFGNPAAATQNTGTFGSSFGSPSAFGQKAVFGSPPSFGQSTFGAPPAFGSSPSFSSPQRMFGPGTTSPPAGTFGAAVQENSTFANLANQSTLGFGSLAQNQPTAAPPQAPQFSGGSQFSSWR